MCASRASLKTTVTSRAFLEKIKVQPPGTPCIWKIWRRSRVSAKRLFRCLRRYFFPMGAIERLCGSKRKTKLDDLATIIFSSGSTGDPKGVLLTHYNVASNVEQLNQVFMLHKDDRILGILPFFHSFGFTGTLCLTSAVGIGVVYHPSPLGFKHHRRAGEQVSRHAAAGDADVSAGVYAAMRAGRFWQFAFCDGRRGKIAGPRFGSVRGSLRNSAAGRLWLHRMFAGGGGEHDGFSRGGVSAGGRQARKYWTSVAGDRAANGRSGNRTRCRR